VTKDRWRTEVVSVLGAKLEDDLPRADPLLRVPVAESIFANGLQSIHD
jgi:hypothetical protein